MSRTTGGTARGPVRGRLCWRHETGRRPAIAPGPAPQSGYDKAAAIAHEAARTGKSIREVVEEQTKLSAAELDAALDPFKMTRPEE